MKAFQLVETVIDEENESLDGEESKHPLDSK
jgi:hypothetical protein